MGPDGIKNFQEYVKALDPDTRRYFELKFNSKELSKTKDQVLDRLFALKRMRTLSRMFSAPKSKFDFFSEMGSAKVILINVPQSLLQEEGVEIVGRFFISMILLAAQKRQMVSRQQRLPCFVYIDECQDFIKRDPKILCDRRAALNGLDGVPCTWRSNRRVFLAVSLVKRSLESPTWRFLFRPRPMAPCLVSGWSFS